MTRFEQLAEVGRRQGGVVAAWQARLLGISQSWLDRQVDSRGWVRDRTGTFRLAGVAGTARTTCWSALLVVGEDRSAATAEGLLADGRDPAEAVTRAACSIGQLTGQTGAWLLGADIRPPAHPQLVVPTDVQVVPDRRIRLVRTLYPPGEGVRVGGLPVAPAPRILWDIAWISRRWWRVVDAVGDVAVYLDRTRQMAVEELVGAVEEPTAFDLPPGPPAALRAAAEVLRPGFSHSRTEAIAREVVMRLGERHGVPVEPRPYKIRHEGRILAEADIAVLPLRWDLEVDGPHHDAPSMRRRDRSRDGRLSGKVAWTVSRYGYRLIDDDLDRFGAMVEGEMLDRLRRAA